MLRFHFMNNADLDNNILRLCQNNNCYGITAFVNRILFENEEEFLIFINCYCQGLNRFRTVEGCCVNRKITIPDVVYHTMKLCHKELDTFSIALIWRSFLIDVVECFNNGGLDEWIRFKRDVIENGILHERENQNQNQQILSRIRSVHIPGILWQDISKVVFFNISSEFLGYLRC